MMLVCDRCGEQVYVWGLNYRMSLDFKDGEPDNAKQANEARGHLCVECRDDFREFLEVHRA